MERIMKFIPCLFIILILCGIGIISNYILLPKIENEYGYENKIYFDSESISMEMGESKALEAGYVSTSEKSEIKWESSNPEVVIVNDGVVQAIKSGEAIVTANFKKYGIKKSCKVTVFDNLSTITTLVVNQPQVTLNIGETYTITTNLNNTNLQFNSSNTGVATVNSGAITAVGPGNTTITITTIDGNYTAQVTVTVNNSTNNNAIVNVSNISINLNSITMYVNDTNTLTATVYPSNATNKNVTWSSSNINVATVKDGVVTGVGKGTATITATTEDGKKTATAKITVKTKSNAVSVTGVKLNKSSITMYVNGTKTLKATVSPTNATNKNVTWSSGNTNVATVKDGVVTAVGQGTATITVKTIDGKKTATAKITVKNVVDVTGVTLNNTNLKMSVGNNKTLKATVSPSNATNKTLIWSSSNTNIVTVEDGVVTAKANGAATVTVTTNNGKSASCLVVVGTPKLTISNTSIKIIDEHSKKLTTSLSYAALDQSVTWSSSDTNVATVDSNGNVTGKSAGTAIITAKSKYDPTITVECTVTVRAAKYLFVGNSKTYYPGAVNEDNGIPKRFKAIAKNAGYEIEYTQAVVGGVGLNTIINDYPEQVAKIKKYYDYVILNGGTTRVYSNRDGYYNDVNTIKNWVEEKNPNVKVYVRKIWIRIKKKNGVPADGSTNAQIQKSYDNAAYIENKLGVGTINDGPVFYDIMDNKSSIHIMRYQDGVTDDLVHQNATGAYLAALCFYAEIYDKDPTAITYNAGINSSTASTLKIYAKKHCYNN